ncbi:MAG TPA: hypothetical protein PK014_02375 [Thermoanaerobaculia bacterium]|nr:hypothetical protein [Thermoanaerobaculia bacterium]HUM28921.1 hypothetical protein [Thermoanaerobaculia bacterium]HXK67146.1 hypothetical protein [Thermoanaerobaculia bacterium]
MKCERCHQNSAEYIIKKTPPGMDVQGQKLHLCSDCAAAFIQRDTVSIVRIARKDKDDE